MRRCCSSSQIDWPVVDQLLRLDLIRYGAKLPPGHFFTGLLIPRGEFLAINLNRCQQGKPVTGRGCRGWVVPEALPRGWPRARRRCFYQSSFNAN